MVFFKERMGLNRWLGLGFVGMVALVLARGEVSLNGDHYLLGIALSLAAASFYAAGTIDWQTHAQNPRHHGDLDAGIGGHAHHVGLGCMTCMPKTPVQWLSVTCWVRSMPP